MLVVVGVFYFRVLLYVVEVVFFVCEGGDFCGFGCCEDFEVFWSFGDLVVVIYLYVLFGWLIV